MAVTFVIDLDGTLLQNDGELHSGVCDFLVRLQEQGYSVIIATGRKYKEAKKILEQLNLKENKNAAILSDGQYLIDYRDGTEVMSPYLVYPDDYVEIMACFKKVTGQVKLITIDQDYDVFPSVYCFAVWKRILKNAIKFSDPFLGVIIHPQNMIEHIEKITIKPHDTSEMPNDDANEQYEFSFVNDKKRFEFKHKGVNKCEMLKRYMEKYNIAADSVYIFGNDENDLCMFDAFSNSIVVDTAQENVKVRANNIIRHCEGFGVIEKIKEIIKGE